MSMQFPRRGGSPLFATMKFVGDGCRSLYMGIGCSRKHRKVLSHRSRGAPLPVRAAETPVGKLASRESKLEKRRLSRKPSTRRRGCKESLDAYETVFKELGLDPLNARWADYERAVLEEYVAFRELSLSSIKRMIPNAIEQLKGLESLLEINAEGKGNEL